MHWDFTYLSGGLGMVSYAMNLRSVKSSAYLHTVPTQRSFSLYNNMARCLATWTVLVLIIVSATVYTLNISHESSLDIVNGLWAGWQMSRTSISDR